MGVTVFVTQPMKGSIPYFASHIHSLFQGPCFPSPCQNGGTCQAMNSGEKSECLCTNGFIGKYCDKGKHH